MHVLPARPLILMHGHGAKICMLLNDGSARAATVPGWLLDLSGKHDPLLGFKPLQAFITLLYKLRFTA